MATGNEELISEFIDRTGVAADKTFFIEQINEIYAAFNKLGAVRVGLNGVDQMAKIVPATKEASAAVDSYEVAVKRVTERIASMNGQSKEFTQVLLADAKAAKTAAETKLLEAKARETNARAALKEADAIARTEKEKVNKKQSPVNIESNYERAAAAAKKQEAAEIELQKALDAQEEARLAVARATQEQDVDLRRYTETQKNSSKAQKDSLGDVSSQANILEEYTGTLKDNLALQASYKQKISATEAEIKLLNKTTSAADKSSIAYKAQLASLNTNLTQYKSSSAALNQTISTQLKLDRAIPGSLEAMRLEYALLTKSIDGLTAAELKSAAGAKLQGRAFALQAEIKVADAAVNTFGRNVGNYGDAIAKGAGKAFSALRKLAYLIPGLGLAGLIGILVDPIVDLFKTIINKETEAAASRRRLSEVYKEAAKSVGDATATLDVYKTKLNDTNISSKDRVKYAEEYNKTADEGNKIDVKQINNLDLINEKIGKQNTLILQRAISLAATAKLGDLASAKVAADLDFGLTAQNAGKTVAEVESITTAYENQVMALGADYKLTRKQREEKELLTQTTAKSLNVSSKELGLIFNTIIARKKATKELLDAEKALAPFIIPPKKDDKKTPKDDNAKKEIDFAKDKAKILADISKAEFESIKQRRQDEINASADIINDSEKSYAERFKATQNFYSLSKELIDLNKEYELKANKDAIDEEIRQTNEKLNKKDLTVKQKQDLNEQLKLLADKQTATELQIKEKFNTDFIKLDQEVAKQVLEINKQVLKDREALEKSQIDHRKSVHENELQQIQNNYDEDIALLDEQLLKKQQKHNGNADKLLKDQKDYDKKKLALQTALQAETLKKDIEFAEAELAIAKANAELEQDPVKKRADLDAIAAAEGKLAAIKIKLDTLITQFHLKNNEEIKKSDQETFDKKIKQFEQIVKYAKEVSDIIGGFVSASVTKELNGIQEQMDALDKKKAKDIEVANQTIANAQDRANAIAVIEARAQAQKDLLDIKKRQAQERQARFDKAANIANIIMETALAVVRALGAKPYTPANIALAAITGAIGAAKIAVAVATPIPKYKHGKNLQDTYEGPAVVGDGGKKEVILREDGTMTLTDNKPQLAWVGKKDIVFPDVDKMLNYIIANNAQKTAGISLTVPDNGLYFQTMTNEITAMKRDVVKAINNKPVLKMNASKDGLSAMWKYGANNVKYINDQTNW